MERFRFQREESMRKCPRCEINYMRDNEEICSVCSGKVSPRTSKSGSKTFYAMGLKNGDIIEFIFNPGVKAKIDGESTVWFEEKEWHLTPLMKELCKRTGIRDNFGSGFEVFRFDNQDCNLYDRWNRYNSFH